MNGVPAKALIDSGADVTVVPAHLVSLSAYTGEKLWTGDLGWSGSLPKARLTLSLQGHETDMTVVVKEGIPEVLVGRDFPGIFDLLIHSSTIAKQKGFDKYPTMTNQVAPLQMMVGEGSKSLAAEAEDQVAPMQTMVGEGFKSLAAEAEDQVAPTQTMVGEGFKSLAAEAEDQVTPMQTMVGEGFKSLAAEAEDQVTPMQTMVGEGFKSLAAEAEDQVAPTQTMVGEGFKSLAAEAEDQVTPMQTMVGEGFKSLAAEAEDQVTPMQTIVGEGSKSLAAEAEDQVAPTQTMVGEGFKSLAAEAEDTEVIGEAADIQAVQTRAQRKRDEQLCLEDDEASAQSGAIPRELCSLDDTLFATSKTKPKLTRSLKRVKAKEWLAQEDKAVQDTEPQLVDLSPEELEKAQHDDTTLAELWNDATADIGGFFVSEGVLRRHHHDEWGDDMAQVVAPTAHRQEILALAHDGPLTAHLGYKKTLEKLLRNFWWPGVQQDVKCHCQTCGDCQRGARGSKGKAPLMPLPAVDEPFRRIAMDIVRPLKRSKRGNKYILTLMDFSTRFPEAIPLRRVDAQTVADAMMGVFCRLGFPEEILTDQGSNFMSEIM